MRFVENFAPFFSDFSVSAFLPSGAEVSVLFDEPPVGAFDGMVRDSDPRITGPEADLSSLVVGDTVRTAAARWEVCAVETSGDGLASFRLKLSTYTGFSLGFSTGFA